MRNALVWAVVSVLFLLGCAGSEPRDGAEGARILDRAARHVAEHYQDQCYEPVAKREVPDDMCQFDLFDKAEREWGTGFGVAAAVGSHWQARLLCSWPLIGTLTTPIDQPYFNFGLTSQF